MKKQVLLLLLIGFGIQLQAQVTLRPGIRGGANFAQITQSDSKIKTDFYLGVYGALKLSRVYTMQPEITYSRQGGNDVQIRWYDYTNNELQFHKEDISASYLSLAMMNKFFLTSKFNIHVGPTLDLQLQENRYINSLGVDLAFMTGIGYTFTKNMTAELRVKKGIINAYDTDNSGDYNYTIGSYNTNFLFQLGLAYTFDLNK
jgi:Outer membrane protein beta-barrel domain